MADSNLLAAILAGQDPLAPQMLQGMQGAQLSATAAANPESTYGPIGVLAKFLGASQGHDMQNSAVQNTTQARIAAQPELARLMANPNPYQELAQNPQGYSPLTRSAFLAGGPRQAQEYQLGQQGITGEALKNLAALSQTRLQGAALGGAMPNAQGITSGAYQGPDWTKILGGGGSPTSGAGGGNVADPRGLAPFIEQTAAKYGIDPPTAVKVASSEGLGAPAGPSGDGGTSGNAFQLHVTPGGKGNAVGDQFMAQTGLNPLDPNNEKATIDFALRHASQNGWGAWSGAKNAGIAPFQGIGGRPQVAQNTAQSSGTDAGSGARAAPGQSMLSPEGTEALKQQALMGAYGAKIPEPLQDYFSAKLMPPGQGRTFALSAALSKSGIKPFIGGERRGSPIFELDPETMQYHLAVQNPQLPEGAIEGPSGDISMAHGALPAISGVAAAHAGGAGQFKPETYYDKFGNPMQGTAAQAPQFANPAPGAAPQQTGGLSAGGAMQGGMPAPPPLSSIPPPKQTPYSAAPSFVANTPTGQRDISQVHVDDMFPGGAGIPQPGGPAGPPTEMQKEIQKTDAERLSTYNKEQGANQQINQDLLRLHGVLERGFVTSNAARIGSELANTAHGLGADWAYPAGWAPASAAEFDKASTDLVFAALKALPGQPRVSEITGLQKANPNLAIPRETNYQMMNDVLARSKWQDERARLATEFTVAHKGVPLALFDSAYNRMAPLPDVANEYMGALRQRGAVFPEDVKAGGGGQGSGTPAAPAGPPARREAIGPGGHRIYEQNGQWFDSITNQPFSPQAPAR
jgi:hypothetical protein